VARLIGAKLLDKFKRDEVPIGPLILEGINVTFLARIANCSPSLELLLVLEVPR